MASVPRRIMSSARYRWLRSFQRGLVLRTWTGSMHDMRRGFRPGASWSAVCRGCKSASGECQGDRYLEKTAVDFSMDGLGRERRDRPTRKELAPAILDKLWTSVVSLEQSRSVIFHKSLRGSLSQARNCAVPCVVQSGQGGETQGIKDLTDHRYHK